MSKVVCIMGESGSGKTTAMRNLPNNETFYIDCDGKGLSWRGWRKQYNAENKNYLRTDKPDKVQSALSAINSKQMQCKYVVVDTLNGIMVGDEMRRSKEKGYDKWVDLASSVFDIVNTANKLRDDLTVIFIAHSQTERDDSGYMFTRMKTNGKKLDKICLESKLTSVLLAKCVDGKYVLETHSNNSTAKTPMGAFETDTVENDVMLVLKALEEY
ncbi:MAG: ATP-binding protein [Ruminococcus sp.]|nr:ATP-binding protein [Ruminococcus sp.]